MSTGMVTAISARILVDKCARRGLDKRELQEGIACRQINETSGQIPVESMYTLWDRAVRLTAEPMLGLRIAEEVPIGAYSLLDYMLVMSSSAGDALNRTCRSFALMNSAFAPSLRLSGELAYFELPAPDRHEIPRPYIEYLLSIYLSRLRFATQICLRPVEVHFRHGQSTLESKYHGMFGSLVRFHQPVDRMVFARHSMDTRHRFADLELCEVLQEHAARKLSTACSGHDMIAEIQEVLARNVEAKEITLAAVARQLARSSRSLQREIFLRGTTFRNLLDRVREKHARNLLHDPHLPLTEIAAKLHFSDLSSFCRAFQRWTGVSPAECRRSYQIQSH